jgi:hypothetical protein
MDGNHTTSTVLHTNQNLTAVDGLLKSYWQAIRAAISHVVDREMQMWPG